MSKTDMSDEFQGGIFGGNMWNMSRDFFGSSPCSISSWPYDQELFVTDVNGSSGFSSDDSTASDGNILQDLIFNNERTEENYSNIVAQESTCSINSTMMNYCDQQKSLVNCPQVVHKTCQSPSITSPNFHVNSNPNSHTSSLLQTLFETESRQQQSLLGNHGMSYSSGISGNFLEDKSPIVKPSYFCSSYKPSTQQQPQSLISSHRSKTRANRQSLSAKVEAGNEPSAATKRARVETPSPLPTFKVRKEKLGDRVTALQQLVSPFGKTDTASVLHEAIEYIKFLHYQISALSAPYLKNASSRLQNHRQVNDRNSNDQVDLKSRGLLLVPISSTFPLASETTADLWTPTFGQSLK